MNKPQWNVDEAAEATLSLVDPEGWYKAFIRWDGCVDLSRYFHTPFTLQDSAESDVAEFHICDVDDLIERLQALKAKAVEHFGEWPD